MPSASASAAVLRGRLADVGPSTELDPGKTSLGPQDALGERSQAGRRQGACHGRGMVAAGFVTGIEEDGHSRSTGCLRRLLEEGGGMM